MYTFYLRRVPIVDKTNRSIRSIDKVTTVVMQTSRFVSK